MSRKFDLSCAALDVQPVDFDWSPSRHGECGDSALESPQWNTVRPDVDSWSLERCRAYLDDHGFEFPEPDPFSTDNGRILFELADGLGVEDFSEENYEREDAAADELLFKAPPGCILPGPDGEAVFQAEPIRAAIVEAIDAEEIDGIEAWREAVRNAMDDDDGATFQPVMSYYYPLPGLLMSAEAAQTAILGTSCVIALVDDEPVLALAGGGMDLSPDICQAYILLGYFPPMHFASNLRRCGAGYREITPHLVEVCIEGAKIAEGWARDNREELERFLETVRKRDGIEPEPTPEPARPCAWLPGDFDWDSIRGDVIRRGCAVTISDPDPRVEAMGNEEWSLMRAEAKGHGLTVYRNDSGGIDAEELA